MEGPPRLRRYVYALLGLLGILAGGTLASHALFAGWSWLNAFYYTWSTVTLAGLISAPNQSAGTVLTIVLIGAGVAVFAYVASTLIQLIAGGVLTGALAERRRRRTIERLRDHFIICGFGAIGRRVAEQLQDAEESFVVLERDEKALAEARECDYLVVEGSAIETEDLEQAGLDRARAIIAATGSDGDNLYITLTARSERDDIQIIARGSDEDAGRKLELAGANRVILPDAAAARAIATLASDSRLASSLDLVSRLGGESYRVVEIEIPDDWPDGGRRVDELEEDHGAVIVGVRTPGGEFAARPSGDADIPAGSVVVAIGTEEQLRALEHSLGAAHVG